MKNHESKSKILQITMNLSFFLKTYSPDFDVLPYALRSIKKYCLNDSYEIVVCSDSYEESQEVLEIAKKNEVKVKSIVTKLEKRVGYIDQQVDKLLSFESCSGAYIFVLDSDMIFFRGFDLDEFSHWGKLLIPYREWGWQHDNMLPPKQLLVRLNRVIGRRIFFLRDFLDCIFSLNENQLTEIGIQELKRLDGLRVVEGVFLGEKFFINSNRLDLLWAYSGFELGGTPVDTMRVHYMVKSASLKKLCAMLEAKYGRSLYEILHAVDIFPAPSEYQIIGNHLMKELYLSPDVYNNYQFAPNHLMYEDEILKTKFPYIKYNGKDRTEKFPIFESIIYGKYNEFLSRSDVIREVRKLQASFGGGTWC